MSEEAPIVVQEIKPPQFADATIYTFQNEFFKVDYVFFTFQGEKWIQIGETAVPLVLLTKVTQLEAYGTSVSVRGSGCKSFTLTIQNVNVPFVVEFLKRVTEEVEVEKKGVEVQAPVVAPVVEKKCFFSRFCKKNCK